MSKATKGTVNPLQLGLIYPLSGAVDIGSLIMAISYQGQDGVHKILEVKAYTEDLKQTVMLLKDEGVERIGMEATGVYWMAFYEMLEEAGIEVTLINPQHYKNSAAQKTDVLDCQWLHQLHAHGLLRPSHLAGEKYRQLRTYLHERNLLQEHKSATLNRIQKALTQMNVKLQHIISDIEGVAGMKIIKRIAEGVTNPEDLLEGVKTNQLKASREDLVKSLQGLYKEHYTIVLKNHLVAYDFYKKQMGEYEKLIEKVLQDLLPVDEATGEIPSVEKKKTKSRKNQYGFNVKDYLRHIAGTDLTAIDGLDEISVLHILSVTGIDLSKWKTSDHFVSWLNLAPNIKKSGGELKGYKKRPSKNMATQAFRLAAQSLWNSKTTLGSLYRRLSSRKNSKTAIKAVARRIAVVFYHMMNRKTTYDPKKVALDEDKIKARRIAKLKKEAEKYGLKLSEAA
jgi:transposase